MQNEAIVYLLRKTHLTLREIGGLTSNQFIEIINEVQRQEAQEEYNENFRIASLLAAIYNTIPRKRGAKVFEAKDFLKRDIPGRNPKQDSLEAMASEKGIKLPSKRSDDG